MAYYDTLDSPLGWLFIGGSTRGLARIDFMASASDVASHLARLEVETGEIAERGIGGSAEVLRQLRGYFSGERLTFDLSLAPAGTEWQLRVWDALRTIPVGQTVTYGAIAAHVGRPTASRAVGAANGRNPIPVVVPCHRVIGSDRTLTGYAGGLHRKQWLLEHEGVRLALGQPDLISAGR